jgi:hypothetical protein
VGLRGEVRGDVGLDRIGSGVAWPVRWRGGANAGDVGKEREGLDCHSRNHLMRSRMILGGDDGGVALMRGSGCRSELSFDLWRFGLSLGWLLEYRSW